MKKNLFRFLKSDDWAGLANSLNAASLAERNEEGLTLLQEASKRGKVKCVKFLCTIGAGLNDVDYYKRTALHYAAMNGKIDCAAIIMSVKDISLTEMIKAIDLAEACGEEDMVDFLVDCRDGNTQRAVSVMEKAELEKVIADTGVAAKIKKI